MLLNHRSEVIDLFLQNGDLAYDGEGVCQLRHAWQCQQLALQENASESLQLAAFLHDIGHLFNADKETPTLHGHNDCHESVGSAALSQLFPLSVTQPIALHVQAKRYLVAIEENYKGKLSPDSVRSLALQGGPMTQEACERFSKNPYAKDAVNLRRWDEAAKQLEWHFDSRAKALDELIGLLAKI
jgi:phosphonate degradation associated HDIG domain protein